MSINPYGPSPYQPMQPYQPKTPPLNDPNKKVVPVASKWTPGLIQIVNDRINNNLELALFISNARQQIGEIKEKFVKAQSQSKEPASKMHDEVQTLIKVGKLEKVNGGKGGVYFLCDTMGQRKYVIKPLDEAMLAVNNNKSFAAPFLDKDNVCSPKEGLKIYESVQNAELAYKAAQLFKLTEITPITEAMLITHPLFHDILDNTEEKNDPDIQEMEKKFPTDKEKLCSVQPYIEDFWDIGALLLSKSKLTDVELKLKMKQDPDEYEKLEDLHTPKDIDQSLYEQIAIFTLLTGEKDGNAGNLLVSQSLPKKEGLPILKIDNAATFPEDNENLITGLCWAKYNYVRRVSEKMKKTILDISDSKVAEFKDLMRSRGKSEESIKAFDLRVQALKKHIVLATSITDVATIEEFEELILGDLENEF